MALGPEPSDGENIELVLPQLEAVLQFTQEVDRRLVDVGVDGIGGALELYRRLKDTLDAIPDAEVERMMGKVRSLGQALSRLAEGLEDIRRFKMLVGSE